MKEYKLKLTAISPLHIGTGEDYEPTNFVIDGGFLYEFDEMEFYKKLPQTMKDKFNQIVTQSRSDSLFQIHSLVKNNLPVAQKTSRLKVPVTKGIQYDYDHKIGRMVQSEGKRGNTKTVFNRFQIARTSRLINSSQVYIPGSSLKGALSTAYQEVYYKKGYRVWQENFGKPMDNIFKNLMVADTQPLHTSSKIGYVLNKERFEEDKLGPSNKMEVIMPGSSFETILKIRDYDAKNPVEFDLLKKGCDEHYLSLFKQSFKPFTTFKGQKVDDFTNEYYPDDYYEKYKDFQLKGNQFLIRVGKHSGARAVTIEGMREIRVKVSGGGPKRKPNRWETLEEETTTWMFGERERDESNLLPMGWVLCEVM